jgi:hypothetical protein
MFQPQETNPKQFPHHSRRNHRTDATASIRSAYGGATAAGNGLPMILLGGA